MVPIPREECKFQWLFIPVSDANQEEYIYAAIEQWVVEADSENLFPDVNRLSVGFISENYEENADGKYEVPFSLNGYSRKWCRSPTTLPWEQLAQSSYLPQAGWYWLFEQTDSSQRWRKVNAVRREDPWLPMLPVEQRLEADVVRDRSRASSRSGNSAGNVGSGLYTSWSTISSVCVLLMMLLVIPLLYVFGLFGSEDERGMTGPMRMSSTKDSAFVWASPDQS